MLRSHEARERRNIDFSVFGGADFETSQPVSRDVAGRIIAVTARWIAYNHRIAMEPALEIRIDQGLRVPGINFRSDANSERGANLRDKAAEKIAKGGEVVLHENRSDRPGIVKCYAIAVEDSRPMCRQSNVTMVQSAFQCAFADSVTY